MKKIAVPPCIVADFETEGIEPRPHYPPKPVSLALKWPDVKEYELLSWGHPSGNNCTEKEARGRLKRAYDSKYPILTQYGTFDHDVAEVHWQLPFPHWEKRHDTMFLIFLQDPHAGSLSLKPSAERLLGIAPEEQDKMYEWIIKNVPQARQKPSTAGAYICKCPYSIVRPYHKGDLVRTFKIFDNLYPYIVETGMLEAYQRDLRLMPVLLRNAARGIPADVPALTRDLPAMEQSLEKTHHWLAKRLKLPEINLNSDQQLGNALYSTGIVTDFKRTPKGQLSVSKKYLTIDRFKDKRVFHALTYFSQMTTSVNMFVKPWLDLAQYDGMLHANWAQVRSPKGDRNDTKGARSGRIICSKPNLLNIPKKWKKAFTAGYIHPEWLGVVPLPFMRTYIRPHAGKRWGRRDYNQQELRLFAFFEEGPVMEGFLTDPEYDIHELARIAEEEALIEAGLRMEFSRDDAKTSVFGDLYGQGVPGLMESLKLREEDEVVARLIKKALHRAVPSIEELSDELKKIAKQGLPIKTWGGRLYYCEESKYVARFGRNMNFSYKLLNYLIQGSGADATKEALIRYDEHPKRQEDLLVTVYDELNIDLPMSDKGSKQEMRVLKECMESIDIQPLKLLSDGEIGPNWGNLARFSI